MGGGDSESVPTGFIGIWSGINVPDGWALCDGSNGTPDLRGRFVLGSNSLHAIGSTGGSEEVTLTVEQMPKHLHGYSVYSKGGSGYGMYMSSTSGITYDSSTGYAGSSQPHSNMPPYYVLAYIMKL